MAPANAYVASGIAASAATVAYYIMPGAGAIIFAGLGPLIFLPFGALACVGAALVPVLAVQTANLLDPVTTFALWWIVSGGVQAAFFMTHKRPWLSIPVFACIRLREVKKGGHWCWEFYLGILPIVIKWYNYLGTAQNHTSRARAVQPAHAEHTPRSVVYSL